MLDTGALIALEHDDPRAWAHLAMAGHAGFLVVIPTSVVMEALEHARSTSRIEGILSKLDSELPLAPRISHQVHALRRLAGSGSEVDAIVVLEALEVPGSMILSSDAGDMHALLGAAGSGGRVPVLRV